MNLPNAIYSVISILTCRVPSQSTYSELLQQQSVRGVKEESQGVKIIVNQGKGMTYSSITKQSLIVHRISKQGSPSLYLSSDLEQGEQSSSNSPIGIVKQSAWLNFEWVKINLNPPVRYKQIWLIRIHYLQRLWWGCTARFPSAVGLDQKYRGWMCWKAMLRKTIADFPHPITPHIES